MSAFDEHIQQIEQTLGRALTFDERKLLKLWDLTSAAYSSAPGQNQGGYAAEPEEPLEQYEGRFKLAFSNGYYEVYFVCGVLRLRHVIIQSAADVVTFLMQEPIYLEELPIRQALASAETGRPMQINQSVVLTEPWLRSMGFEHP